MAIPLLGPVVTIIKTGVLAAFPWAAPLFNPIAWRIASYAAVFVAGFWVSSQWHDAANSRATIQALRADVAERERLYGVAARLAAERQQQLLTLEDQQNAANISLQGVPSLDECRYPDNFIRLHNAIGAAGTG
jgi:hypothetical protein